MANLSNAIIEARKRHEAEIAERLKRRQERQRAEVDRLNQSATGAVDPAPRRSPPPETDTPTDASSADVVSEPALPAMTSTAVEPRVEESTPAVTVAAPVSEEATSGRPASHVHAPVSLPEPVPLAPQPVAVPPEPAPVAIEPRVLPPAPVPARIAAPPQPSAYADELETPPDGRFLKLRNDIIDRVKPFLTGNQFAVYLEIYRQTIGRGRTSAWFRTREIQTACNLGSDNTVRDAYPALEAKRLIRLDPNRRVGSPRGLLITVLSVERALERLERGQAPTPAPFVPDTVAAPATYVPLTVEAGLAPGGSADPVTDSVSPVVADDAPAILDAIKRKYGVSPTVAPAMLDLVAPADRPLLPYLFRHLDRSVASGKVHNPAGLLRVWLESFDAWRPELAAERDAEEQARRAAAESLTKDELMLEWFRETEELVQERYAALDEDTREITRLRGRRQMLAKSPSVRAWNEQQWEAQLETFVKSEIRRELGTFEEWLARRGST